MAHERVFEAFVPTYSGRFGGSHIIHLYRGSIRIYIPLDVNIKDAPVTILERVLSVEGPQSSPELGASSARYQHVRYSAVAERKHGTAARMRRTGDTSAQGRIFQLHLGAVTMPNGLDTITLFSL